MPMKNYFWLICSKLMLTISVVVSLNEIYNLSFFSKDLNDYSPMGSQILKHKNVDIYYFGESSNATFANNDSTKESISELISHNFSNFNFATIDTGAVHAGIYKYWLNMINLKTKPKTIIVTMNLRSFGAGWIHSKLETSIQKSTVLMRGYPNILNRFALALGFFDNKSEKERFDDMINSWKKIELNSMKNLKYKTVLEWDSVIGNGGWLLENGNWDIKKIQLACHYIKAYAFNIDESNPRIKDFDEILEWGKSNGVKIIFSIMPENVEYADSCVGEVLVDIMRQNRDFLVKRYSSQGAFVVDNLELVEGRNYIDQDWTSEHYNQVGRIAVAKHISKVMRDQMY